MNTIAPFDGRKGKKLPAKNISELRFFAFYIGNETLLSGTKWGIKYDVRSIGPVISDIPHKGQCG